MAKLHLITIIFCIVILITKFNFVINTYSGKIYTFNKKVFLTKAYFLIDTKSQSIF